MVELLGRNGVYLINGRVIIENKEHLTLEEINKLMAKEGLPAISVQDLAPEKAKTHTIAYNILTKHNTTDNLQDLKLRFDAWHLMILLMWGLCKQPEPVA